MKNTLSNYNVLLYATAYKNLDDIYKINEEEKQVYVITVLYGGRNA